MTLSRRQIIAGAAASAAVAAVPAAKASSWSLTIPDLEHAARYVSVEVENGRFTGFRPSKEKLEILKMFYDGRISADELRDAIFEITRRARLT
jgi:hypothetical protein